MSRQKQVKILTADWVLPITKEPLKNGAVAVSGSQIKAVDSFAALKQIYPQAEVTSFPKAIIMPGFVDAHTHVEYAGFRGLGDDLSYVDWRIRLSKKEAKFNKSDWFVSAKLGVAEAVQSGITFFANLSATDAGLEALKEAGVRGRVYYEVVGVDHKAVPETVSQTVATINRWQEKTADSYISIGVAPHSVYTVCPPLIKAVGEQARKNNWPVSIHLAGSQDEVDFIKYGSSKLATEFRETNNWSGILWQPTGVTPVKYVLQWGLFANQVLAAHCLHVTDADLTTLKKYNVAIAHCPKCSAKLGMGIAPLRDFLQHGLKVGLGTDSPASNNTMDMFDEMRVGLLLQRGLTQTTQNAEAKQFVRLATYGGAQALGLEKEIGSLEPGKAADLIVVDVSQGHQQPLTDPYSALVFSANQENVRLTMVGGRILYQDGCFYTLNFPEIVKQVQKLKQKLSGKV